jgi:hypothetical protein
MSMHVAIRRFPVAAIAVGGSLLLAACGGSGAGLIPTANAGPLEQDFVEVWERARTGNGSCQATSEALEKTEADFVKISASIDASLRRRLQDGITRLHSQALEQCSHATTTSTTTLTTRTHSESFAPVTTTSETTSQAPPSTPAPRGEEEEEDGGGTPAPRGGGETPNPGGAEAQGGQPGESGGGGPGLGGGH